MVNICVECVDELIEGWECVDELIEGWISKIYVLNVLNELIEGWISINSFYCWWVIIYAIGACFKDFDCDSIIAF